MRLLLVTNDYPPKRGGIQQFWAGVVDHYPDPLRILAPSDPRNELAPGDVVRHRRSFLWPTGGVRTWVETEAKAFRPDVVVFGAPHPLAWLGPRLRKELGVPFAVMCHGAEVTMPAVFPIARQLLRRPLAAADAVFAVSRFTARRVEALAGRPVHYVGAGVDVDIFHPADDEAGPAFRVVCVSRFVPRKGHARLFEAVARLRREGRPVSLTLVGRGRLEGRLRRLAAELEVPVTFEVDVPWDSLGELYRRADAFCMPCRSRWFGLEVEGLGLVFLEAAASGLPVIAGTSGGAPETVVPGMTGFLAVDPGEVAEALRILMVDRRQAAAMAAAGRERVVEEFTWDRVVARLVEGLQGAVGTGGAASDGGPGS